MTVSIEIRAAASGDADALSSLLSELGFPASTDVVSRRLAMLIDRGETVLVAVVRGDVVGFVSLHMTPVLHRPAPVGRLTALVVSKRIRRRGIGSRLVAAAEEFLTNAGCSIVELTSNLKLHEAHAFYERQGYAVTSHRFCKTLFAFAPCGPR